MTHFIFFKILWDILGNVFFIFTQIQKVKKTLFLKMPASNLLLVHLLPLIQCVSLSCKILQFKLIFPAIFRYEL